MKKKILFMVQLPPPVHGSSIMNQYVVKSQLIQSGFNCCVLPLPSSTSIADIDNISLKKLWRIFIYCFRLMGKLISFRPHAVYFSVAPVGKGFYRDALFIAMLRLFRCKRIYHLQGKGVADEAARSSFKRALYKFTFKNSHVIILAASLHQDIRSVYSGQPFIVPNAAPGPADSEPKSDTPVFLYLSNLVITKGIKIFLQCIHALHQKQVPFKAYIAGAPYDMSVDDVKQFIAEHQLSAVATVVGPVYGKEKEALFREANIMVFPTYYLNEAFPVSIVEAMRSGLAVVSTNNGGIPEIIEDSITGFVTPMQDVAAMTEKMEFLARNTSLRKEMGLKAMKRFEAHFTVSSFEQRLHHIFDQITKD